MIPPMENNGNFLIIIMGNFNHIFAAYLQDETLRNDVNVSSDR